ncbi:hypothetical protein B566_EDAN004754 [Ephemera danica]|nr:hypothetical protein B566_EDAN004754 [Ephemera danica]
MLDLQFQRDGYVVLEDFLSPEQVQRLRDAGETLARDTPDTVTGNAVFSSNAKTQSKNRYFLDSGDKISHFLEAGAVAEDGSLTIERSRAINKVGHALHWLHEDFQEVTFSNAVKETCFQLGMEDPAVVQSMYIYKNPGIGSEESKHVILVEFQMCLDFRYSPRNEFLNYLDDGYQISDYFAFLPSLVPHQDATYLYTEPVRLVGFWFALDDATQQNGCLWIAPGSHRGGVHRRYVRNPDPTSDELLIYTAPAPMYPNSNFRAVPVKKGSCVLIHGQVVHHSEPNRSDKPRHAYTFHVVEQKNTKYAEDNWLQPSESLPFPALYKN